MNSIFKKIELSLYVPLDYLAKHNKLPNKNEIIHIFISLNIGIISDIYYIYEINNSPKGMYIYFDYLYEGNDNVNWFVDKIYTKYAKIVFDDPTYMKCYLNRYHNRIQNKIVNSSIYNDYSIINISQKILNKMSTMTKNYYTKPILTRSYNISNQYIYYYNELLYIYNMLIHNYKLLGIENNENFEYILDYNLYSILHDLYNPLNGINLYNEKKKLQIYIYEIVMDFETKLGCSFS